MRTEIRYKQIKSIIDLLEACDQAINVDNIQKVATVMDISVSDQELEYLIAILKSMTGGKQ